MKVFFDQNLHKQALSIQEYYSYQLIYHDLQDKNYCWFKVCTDIALFMAIVEAVGEKLRGMMPWISAGKMVYKDKN